MDYQVYYLYDYHGKRLEKTREFATEEEAVSVAAFIADMDSEKEDAGIVDDTYENIVLVSRRATEEEIEDGEADEDGWVGITF